jgi:hypothetical protein
MPWTARDPPPGWPGPQADAGNLLRESTSVGHSGIGSLLELPDVRARRRGIGAGAGVRGWGPSRARGRFTREIPDAIP